MHTLITSQQNIKLKQMLDDQNVSIENIENIEVDFEEVTYITPEQLAKLKPRNSDVKIDFNPFQDDPKLGIKKITDDFTDWAQRFLDKPNGLF